MNISVKPFGGARISIPERVSFYEGEKLAHEKIRWIEEHVEKMRGYEKTSATFDENSNYYTRNHKLELKRETSNKISIRVKNSLIKIKFPLDKDVKSIEVQKAIRKGIDIAYKEEAKEYLPKRLNDLSDKFGLPFKELYIKNVKKKISKIFKKSKKLNSYY